MGNVDMLRSYLKEGDSVVFLGGAGTSTDSSIPDFRSASGLYGSEAGAEFLYPPEVMLSHSFFMENTEEFYRFYLSKMIYKDAKPNYAHSALAQLELSGKLKAVITQNIDGLHQMAGSRKVIELHGSVHRNTCLGCGRFYSLEEMLRQADTGIPKCVCGGVVKPDVVLYEEPLDTELLSEAVGLIADADILIVGGTSLTVYPAAGLVDYYRGNRLVLINRSATGYDAKANLIIKDSIGKVLKEAVNSLE